MRNLTLAYTLAGADCIDVAADPAVIAVAKEALDRATRLKGVTPTQGSRDGHRPWLMISLNDGEDPHFRKAQFNPDLCPANCPRPCERICPAQAISFQDTYDPEITTERKTERVTPAPRGVIDQRCYGCGRCVPICPSQLIYTRSYVSAPTALAELVLSTEIDALEIHTKVGNFADFQRLWQAIAPWLKHLKLLAISCPDAEGLIDYLWSLYHLMTPLPCPLIWQTDGRPMSGDIGIGATSAAVKLAQKVLAAGLPGYVQLAGGTNQYTVSKLSATGLLRDKHPQESFGSLTPTPQPYVAGIAYGSYARVLLSPILEELEQLNEQTADAQWIPSHNRSPRHLEDCPDLLEQAVARAYALVSQLKSSPKLGHSIPL